MKPSILLGGLVALPIAAVLMVQYAATPQDALKAVGYLTISLYAAFVWASATLFIEGIRRFFRKGKGRGGSAPFLLPGLVCLIFSLTFFWKMQSAELLKVRLAKEVSGEVLRKAAERAVSGRATPLLLVIAANPHTPAEVLNALAGAELTDVTEVVAKNPNAPEALLKELSQHQSYLVRLAVVENPTSSKALLEEMSESLDSRIRRAVAERLAAKTKD